MPAPAHRPACSANSSSAGSPSARPIRTAATEFLRALAARPDDADLLQQAFIACLVAGRTEAVQLARQLPDSQAAQLLLGDVEVRAGHWQAARAGVPAPAAARA